MSSLFLQRESHTLNSPFLKTYPGSKSYSWLLMQRIVAGSDMTQTGFVTVPHDDHAVYEGLRNTSPVMKTAS